METLNVYEKILRHLLKIENEGEGEYQLYIREEDNPYPVKIEWMMLNRELGFTTKLKNKKHVEICMSIFQSFMWKYLTFMEESKLFHLFDNLDLNINIHHAEVEDNKEFLEICTKYGLKTDGSPVMTKLESGEYVYLQDSILYFMKNAKVEELMVIEGFQCHKYEEFIICEENECEKTMNIKELLEKIQELKMLLWKGNKIEEISKEYYKFCLFRGKKEYVDYMNLYDFLPELIHERHKVIYQELIEKTWIPERMMDWCLEYDFMKK